MIVLSEVLCVAALVAFCVVVWWPAAILVFGIACGLHAWNLNREGQK